MKILETKFLQIGEEKYPIRVSFKTYIKFEELAGKSIEKIGGIKDVTYLLYAGVKVGSEFEKTEFKLSYNEFLDLIDQYPDVVNQVEVLEINQKQKKSTKKK